MARILVASDDPDLQSIVTAHLRDDAHHVECAVSGAEALRLLTAGPLDLVLVDCTLLGEEAEFLAARVTSRFGLPVILMTGFRSGSSASSAARCRCLPNRFRRPSCAR
jgi:two-component system OmpR family response regulator/two-component system phosphate regulon response regulator OmpR